MKKPAEKGSAKHAAPAPGAKHAAAKPGAKHAAPATGTKHAPTPVVTPVKPVTAVKKAPTPARKASPKAAPKTAPKKTTGTKGAPASAFSPFELVACCSAAAVADHLRLSGGSCSADEMLELYFSVTADPDSGASLEDVLAYAAGHGLAGAYPEYRLAVPDPDRIQVRRVLLPEGRHAMVWHDGEWLTWGARYPQSAFSGVTEQAWEVSWR